MGRSPSRAAAAVLAAALLAAACGDDDTSTAADTTVETTVADEAAADDTDEGTDEDPGEPADVDPDAGAEEGTVIEVRVSGGQIDGGGRAPVALGETVTIRVTSDVADHVHLHGYDVLADVGAGETAELTFTADIPGVFEVELEDAGLPLLELEVS